VAHLCDQQRRVYPAVIDAPMEGGVLEGLHTGHSMCCRKQAMTELGASLEWGYGYHLVVGGAGVREGWGD